MTDIGLTEREIVEVLKKRLDGKRKLPLGFDDDVAAFPNADQELVVLKSDMLIGSTDVPPGMTLKQASRKSIVAAVSDFAAKGVQPKAFLVSLGLQAPVRLSMVKEIAEGLGKTVREYGCRIIGGDTGQADDLIIDCIGFGFASKGRILKRSGAKPGDVVAVTGDFGKTAAGLRILLNWSNRLSRRFPQLVHSILHPVAKLQTGLGLAHTKAVTASIDSSDGLAWSLHEIARLSHVDVQLERIPVARDAKLFAKEMSLMPEELALYGGEEYELVVTIKRHRFDDVNRSFPSLRRIGRIKKGRGGLNAFIDGKTLKVEPRGYEHFLSNPSANPAKDFAGRTISQYSDHHNLEEA